MTERILITGTIHRIRGSHKQRLSLIERVILDRIPRERQEAAGIKFYADTIYVVDAERSQRFKDGRPIVRPGSDRPDGLIWKWRTKQYPQAIADARPGDHVTMTATVDRFDNGLGGYLTRCVDITIVDPESADS